MLWQTSAYQLLRRINALEPAQKQLSDYELRKAGLSMRYRARCGESLESIMPEAFALVREAGRRACGMRHYDVQILGGIATFRHTIVEMQTGEGKTLTATLPLYLYALAGRGAYLATVNDYLARRDAETMGPIYSMLGMRVGLIQEQMPQDKRREAYHSDITYGTAKEFGFDFLRDRLLLRNIREGKQDLVGSLMGKDEKRGDSAVQREAFFALVDEADSILIDEASTPLVISAMPTEEQKTEVECYRWAASMAEQFDETRDYEVDDDKKTITLTRAGRQKVRLIEKGEALDRIGLYHLYEDIERAIRVARDYHLDQQYIVRKGEIVIVDEFTGRLGEGRKWRGGIHQAVEASAGVEVTVETGQAARITVQDYFLRFKHLAGMTGTAASSKRELRSIYRCRVEAVPTNKPPRRQELATRIFPDEKAKWLAIIDEVEEIHAARRPILIGTRTIDKSMIISSLLKSRGIDHRVLNANRIAEEAEIVARAGEESRVTVSTNMAGRGTDIKLSDEVIALGGLQVICTEMHDSARIDRQLIGRCGRQGDPGTYRQYLSLEDEMLSKAFGTKWAKRLTRGSTRLFRRAQRKMETKSFRSRKVMLYYEKERKKSQRTLGQDPYLDAAE